MDNTHCLYKDFCYTKNMDKTLPANEPILEIQKLNEKLAASKLPPELLEKATFMVKRAETATRFGGYFAGIEQTENYIDLITHFPWFTRSEDIIDIQKAKTTLDKNHFGLNDVKNRILEYIAVLKLSKAFSSDNKNIDAEGNHRAPILLLVGLPGAGKTTLASSIAESMGRKFIRIPFGGLGSAKEIRGQSRVFPDAEPGLIVKAIDRAGTRNPVLLFDELDRVTAEARADIMGVLVELMDPNQNKAFTDHYLDYPIDLSEVLFVATSNKTDDIAQAVLDRFEVIRMPFYNDKEKTEIGKNYMFPKILKATGLQPNQLIIQDACWPGIIRPSGYDPGMRTLERTIISICRIAARMIVEGKAQSITVTPETLRDFIHSDVNLY